MVVVYLTALACANAPAPATDRAAAGAPPAEGPLVVFLGDSLTAGYGLAEDESFPSLLGRSLSAHGLPIRVVNAGVSGDTTTGGLGRVDWVLQQKPDVVVVGLGANDAFRDQDPSAIEANLRAIVARSKQAGAKVLLLGMRIPTNYGPANPSVYAAIYPRVAEAEHVPLVPFLLDGVGGRAALNQDDGIHPNAEGEKLVAENVRPYLETIVRSLR